MPLRLEIKKKLGTRTERVKSVDFHPEERWILSALYSGHLVIYNWEDQSVVRTIEACPNVIIRCAKFVPRKQWVICAADDMTVRVFNHDSMEKVKHFVAHTDFIRYLAVHSNLPLILTASDDMSVKLWDWSRDWVRVASFESHIHYVLMCQWNPRDPYIFASASLDRTVKVWSSHAVATGTEAVVPQPNFTLTGHEKGVNSIEYAPRIEKPYIVSGSDDRTVRIWDYQTKQCVSVLSGHSNEVLCVAFHPFLPIILSGDSDGAVSLWHETTYRLETTLKYKMGRIWGLSFDQQSNAVGVATDSGTIVIKVGSEAAVCSMHGGKVVVARGSDILTSNLRLIDDSLYGDGERLPVAHKDLGACEVFPQSISHHPTGRFIAVCGDGEYVVYTAQALRNKCYGKALDFVWSPDGNYAIRDTTGNIVVFHNFKEKFSFKPPFPVEDLSGGWLIGLRNEEFIAFYDWNEYRLVRRIDVNASGGIYWNNEGTAVALGSPDSFFVLRYSADIVASAFSEGLEDDALENALAQAFQLENEVPEKIESGFWVSSCFCFVSRMRIHTLISNSIDMVAFLDRPCRIIGYIEDVNRLYLVDRDLSVVSFKLYLSMVNYQAAICRRDFAAASTLFHQIPEEFHNKVARFLETEGHHEAALEVTRDLDHKFELARRLGKLDLCTELIREAQRSDSKDKGLRTLQWRLLGDTALQNGAIRLALASYAEGKDLTGLLLINSAINDPEGLERVATLAVDAEQHNIAFMAYFLLADVGRCVDLLLRAGRVAEAALFARTYAPQRLAEVVGKWREKLAEAGREHLAKSLGSPDENPELFEQLPNFAAKTRVASAPMEDQRSSTVTLEQQPSTASLEQQPSTASLEQQPSTASLEQQSATTSVEQQSTQSLELQNQPAKGSEDSQLLSSD